jgi:hypothetical protein
MGEFVVNTNFLENSIYHKESRHMKIVFITKKRECKPCFDIIHFEYEIGFV